MFYIDPVTCIDCGACESLCPVEAIYKACWVPSRDSDFVAINQEATAGLSEASRGSACSVSDHPAVAATPQPPNPRHTTRP